MEWLSNLGTADVLLIIIIMYLHYIRTDLSGVKGEIQRFRIQWLNHTNNSGGD